MVAHREMSSSKKLLVDVFVLKAETGKTVNEFENDALQLLL